MKNLKKSMLAAVGALSLTLSLGTTPNQAKAGLEPFLGDIMIVGFNFCPRGWSEAAGQLLPIAQNQALFSLLGTQFGGDGITTFALPDLRGRITVGQGTGNGLTPRLAGQRFGSETKVMTEATMPQHSHTVQANNLDGDLPGPGNKLLAAAPTGGSGNETIYSQANPNVTMSAAMIAPAGASTPISTLDPTLALYHCIATVGAFPSRN
ncbi:microcystin dependent protein, putative [Roseovarius sp. TM1035]|jgi:microcystin-dependent protein|uniref:Phage Tail Collar Domain protein n=2 Tax=Roseobacteraceae TaxID=2854170 RepID=A0A1V0RPG5_9RHOB|nr:MULTISPECIES: tail fiber protein [Roseovarius]ARE83472.1 phage Tail Collar Domain protein [Roseovarius mucosus]AWZ19899.1 Microcystin dependent protein [Roseovarius sp. AK1035]EDM30378.1 microcystin dependent protein, putative [Roseovarius sp. TM1035]